MTSRTALSGNIAALLANTTLIRIIDAPTPEDAVPIIGTLGVDNIQALAVPEPHTYALMLLGLSLLGALARKAHRADGTA